MNPSFSDILYFIEVAKAQNISRAAERLAISQPSLSIALTRLEDSVGSKLLHRSKKGVYLTAAGETFLADAENLIKTWNDIKAKTQENETSAIGNIKLGCHASVALYTLRYFMPKFLKENPKISFTFQHDLSRKISESVISRKIDVGIVVNAIKHADLIIKPLLKDQVSLWGSAKLMNPEVLICDPDLVQSQSLMRKLGKMNITRSITTSSLEVVASLTASGAGYGILPARVAENYSHLGIQKVKDSPVFEDEIAVIYRVENKKSFSIKATVTAIEKSLK